MTLACLRSLLLAPFSSSWVAPCEEPASLKQSLDDQQQEAQHHSSHDAEYNGEVGMHQCAS